MTIKLFKGETKNSRSQNKMSPYLQKVITNKERENENEENHPKPKQSEETIMNSKQQMQDKYEKLEKIIKPYKQSLMPAKKITSQQQVKQ